MTNEKPKLGATGRFPEGQFASDDKGELAVGISIARGKIIISFGNNSVQWIATGSKDARKFAAALIQKADELDRGA